MALAIAALGLAFLMAAAGTGLENASLADQYIQATARAQSHLARVGVTVPLRRGDYAGDDGDGYRWQVHIALPAASVAASEARTVALYPVTVSVSWQGGFQQKSVSLYSERMGPP